MRDFIQEFRNRMAQIDAVPSKARYDAAVEMIEPLFKIYKRAVPYRTQPINRAIALGLTRKEADEMMIKLIRREAVRRIEDLSQNVYFMYDIVPENASPEETSPFYNEGSPVL